MEVHQEQLGGVRIRQKTGVDLQSQLGDELGERPRAGGMCAGIFLEPLDSFDQGQLTGTQPGAARRAAALSLKLELSLKPGCAAPKSNGLNFNPGGRGC